MTSHLQIATTNDASGFSQHAMITSQKLILMSRRGLRLHLVIHSRQKVSENRVLDLDGVSGTHGFFAIV